MFHRVLPEIPATTMDKRMVVSTDKFKRILMNIRKELDIVDLYDWINKPTKKRCCAITFDDGWLDNYEYAFPILKELKIPATIFLATGMVESKKKFWFTRLQDLLFKCNLQEFKGQLNDSSFMDLQNIENKYDIYNKLVNKFKRMPYDKIDKILCEIEKKVCVAEIHERQALNWKEIEIMSRSNISFASHGVEHAIFTLLNKNDLIKEIKDSKQALKKYEKKIKCVPMISFPNGNYNQDVIDVCQNNGFEVLLTASINNCGDGIGRNLISRINVSEQTDFNILFLKFLKARMTSKLLIHRKKIKC